MNLLHVSHLIGHYDQVKALNGVTLDVAKEEIVTVIGSNGSGKSTLLMGLAGLLKRINGTIRFKGQMVAGWSAPRLVKMGLVLVPEGRQLFPQDRYF